MTENERLRAALRQQAAWVRHWQEDFACGLAPTFSSLADAAEQISAALIIGHNAAPHAPLVEGANLQ
ncbi:hypothetical protein [Ensifer sp. 1H6]|uniref:hypothetical protein n=1 Tax=Ensifer sp. 1H6 TaxID=1911585 RepID=UPI0009C56F97|nr:hypothetical protein [Ensifer sp. 1H6]OMQ44722.1 hypothetical protein BKP54_09910 [Ensifer sp. 1H6]